MPHIEVDGCSYDVVARCIRKENAIYVDADICTNDKIVARFRMRCASHEPQYTMLCQTADPEIVELATSGITPERVRSALWFESQLRQQNPVNGVLGAIFPENYRADAHV